MERKLNGVPAVLVRYEFINDTTTQILLSLITDDCEPKGITTS
jgi:hypothetical protein